ncbi:MAG: hypothetical protein KGZ85_01740 [Ignavibacterium sp.]|nr:hypothetical protein [Ignavibacterium sp.]
MPEKILCDYCGNETTNDSEFCIKCGSIFIDDVYCLNHSERYADGVCAICHQGYCKKCGLRVNSIFLCNEHSDYEIYEGMARIYGSIDDSQINFLKSSIEKEGFHPFIYNRKATPMHLGGSDHSLFRSAGDSRNVIINEIKLVVPCSEVLEAKQLINDLLSGGDIVFP